MCNAADGGAAALPADVAQSLVGALQQSALAFCAACYALRGAGAGPTLRGEALALARGVVEPCVALLDAVEAGRDVKRAVGHVWSGCDAAAKAPADNRGAVFKGLAGVMAVLKDTLREMAELREEAGAAAAAGGGSDGGGGGDGGDGKVGGDAEAEDEDEDEAEGEGRHVADLDLDCGRLSAGEEALLGESVGLMEAAAAVVRAMGRALLAGPPLRASGPEAEALEAWESELYHARALRRCVEDLGAALFPPADASEAAEAAEAAATTCELMIDECPDGAADAAAGELDGLAARVREAADAVAKAAAAVGGDGGGDGEDGGGDGDGATRAR